jgi:hypothetical protein
MIEVGRAAPALIADRASQQGAVAVGRRLILRSFPIRQRVNVSPQPGFPVPDTSAKKF